MELIRWEPFDGLNKIQSRINEQMSSQVRILGIAGSLRRGSYNQAALRAAKLLVPENRVDSTIFMRRTN